MDQAHGTPAPNASALDASPNALGLDPDLIELIRQYGASRYSTGWYEHSNDGVPNPKIRLQTEKAFTAILVKLSEMTKPKRVHPSSKASPSIEIGKRGTYWAWTERNGVTRRSATSINCLVERMGIEIDFDTRLKITVEVLP